MLPYFILGVALLTGVVLAGRWFMTAEPRSIIGVFKWTGLAMVIVVVVFFAVTGRLGWALMMLPVLLPWFMRFRALARTAKNFSRMSAGMGGGGGAGQGSKVETRFLRVTLDHGSGAMEGEVLEGEYAGRVLEELSLGELVDLLRTCWVEDERSAQVLEAYLDRNHQDWREQYSTGDAGTGRAGASGKGAMTEHEALEVLGLEPGAGADEIKEAYRRLIANLHPDHGGSSYLAAKINQAKDVLLGD